MGTLQVFMANKILIIGSGGREHSLAWKLSQSPKVEKIFVAPGNPGVAKFAETVNIPATNINGLLQFAIENKIDLTVVGPDDPLALGIVDAFKEKGLKIFGPSQAAAQIEASKAFAKDLMKENKIPTAQYQIFTDYNQALDYVKKYFNLTSRPILSASEEERKDFLTSDELPNLRDSSARMHSLGMTQSIVIKASGLALGKGVAVCQDLDEAEDFLRQCMVDKIFGEAGMEVVIEEFLQGQEFSAHAISDGTNFIMFPPSQDHKRVFNGDKGPNTGGMGTIAPLPWVSENMINQVASDIVKLALLGLKNLGTPFSGLLYPGLVYDTGVVASFMGLNRPDKSGNYNGPVKVIEFNSRFGDPECESYMRLLKSDLFDALFASASGNLDGINLEWYSGYACCIMLASGGYPGSYEKGKEISGIKKAEQLNDIIIFHAGTKMENGKLVTNGGRVLGVTATGDDLQSALDKAYQAVKLINFEGMHYRSDIGAKSLISPASS